MSESSDVQDRLTHLVHRQVEHIARLLEDAAANVRRHGEVRVAISDLKLNHSQVAAEVSMDIARLMGNMRMDALIQAAFDADVYARNGDPE